MPHKLSNLWEKIANYDTLYTAWKEVKQRKSKKVNILRYESNLSSNLSRLEGSLLNENYRPKPHFEFWINDPKPRLIQAPHLEDRIVQHAVCNVLRVPLTNRLIAHTYSCLLNRGTHKCSSQLQKYLKDKKYKYYLSLDISKFFYSIDHTILFLEIKKYIKCKKTLNLLWLFITINGGHKGIPIGASTSQILANLALNPLDHFAKRQLKLKTYLRYCDDMVALFENAEEAHFAFSEITNKVKELKMDLNSKSGVGWVDQGVDWVGYRHWKNYKLIRKRSLKKLKQKISTNCSIETTMAYLSHAKSTASLRKVASLLWSLNKHQRPEIFYWLVKHKNYVLKDIVNLAVD